SLRVQRRVPAAIGIAGAAGALVWIGSAALSHSGRDHASGPVLDTTRYAVLPIENTAAAAVTAYLDQPLRDAVARWNGITVADLPEVRDAFARQADRRVSM